MKSNAKGMGLVLMGALIGMARLTGTQAAEDCLKAIRSSQEFLLDNQWAERRGGYHAVCAKTGQEDHRHRTHHPAGRIQPGGPRKSASEVHGSPVIDKIIKNDHTISIVWSFETVFDAVLRQNIEYHSGF